MCIELQESGELRKGHRIKWRGPSYLNDGKKQGIDLTGGYHDAGGKIIICLLCLNLYLHNCLLSVLVHRRLTVESKRISFVQPGQCFSALEPHADHLKLMFPLCWTMVQIAWSMHSGAAVLKNGTFDSQTNWHWSMQTLLHGLEFLFKCHLKPGVFVAQVGSLFRYMSGQYRISSIVSNDSWSSAFVHGTHLGKHAIQLHVLRAGW